MIAQRGAPGRLGSKLVLSRCRSFSCENGGSQKDRNEGKLHYYEQVWFGKAGKGHNNGLNVWDGSCLMWEWLSIKKVS